MTLDELPFPLIESAGLEENRVRDADLADVVQQGAVFDVGDGVVVDASVTASRTAAMPAETKLRSVNRTRNVARNLTTVTPRRVSGVGSPPMAPAANENALKRA